MATVVALSSGTRGRPATPAQNRAREAEEIAARDKKNYGDALPDVQLLRRLGYTVSAERGGIRVGNKLLSLDEVKAMGARERGLVEAASSTGPVRKAVATVSGLRIGDAVPIGRASSPAPRSSTEAATEAPARKLSGAAHTAQQRAQQHSSELGARPLVVWLGLELLKVDKRYQREINKHGAAHINRILKAFNWNCYQPVIVTAREDGTYAVIDGQQRLEAAKKHPLVDALPCYVIDAPDVARQAAVFVAVNSVRRALTSQQKFWAAHAAGDKHAIALARICELAGVKILRGPPGGAIPPMSLLGPVVPQKLVARFGERPVGNAIQLIADTHPETPNAFRSATIVGLTRITAAPDFVRDRVKATLARTNLDRLIASAMLAAKGDKGGSMGNQVERLLRQAMKKH